MVERTGTSSNIGQLGLESVRIANTQIADLPLVAGAHAKNGIAAFLVTEKENRIATIKAKYPPEMLAYLNGWVVECNANVQRIQTTKHQQAKIINDYTGHISMCKYRDEELAKLDPEVPGDLAQIKILKKRFPPYDVGRMEDQIKFCKEALQRCDDVIEKEFKSLAMLQERIGLCQMRDRELIAAGGAPIG